MTVNRKIIFIAVAALIMLAVFFMIKGGKKITGEMTQAVSPEIGNIQTMITSTGNVQPENRLEIKPPINGRIDQIMVTEGQEVKTGDVLALMSSMERAALLDAAKARGAETVKYWEDVYKATPLISPIDGDVIVSTVEPGQTVTSSDVVVVLSDHLIVQAQVDETDIGKLKVGQKALISLDAYPQVMVEGKVVHIYYESKIVNNVTIYQVDILPDKVPEVFRSGMSASVSIIKDAKENVLTIPIDAVKRNKDGTYVLVSAGKGRPVQRKVEIGLMDEKRAEVMSGLTIDDKMLVVSQKYIPSNNKAAGTNPFMPQRRR